MDKKGKKQQKLKQVKKQAKSVTLKPKSTEGLRDQALSRGVYLAQVSESEIFELAARMVLAMLDPDAVSAEKITLPFLTETIHCVFPRVVRPINCLTSSGVGRFSCVSRPSIYGGVYLTDTSVVPPTLVTGKRVFLGNQFYNVMSLTPPGRYEEDTPFSCYMSQSATEVTVPQLYMAAPSAGSIVPSNWDKVSVGGWSEWAYYFGVVFDNAAGVDSVITIDAAVSLDSSVAVTYRTYIYWSKLVAGVWVAQATVIGNLARAAAYTDAFSTSLTLAGSTGFRCRLDRVQFGWIFATPGFTVNSTSRSVSYGNAVLVSSDDLLYLAQSDLVSQIEDTGERAVCSSHTQWFHWFGSTLQNGGSIVGYRMPKNYPILSLSGNADQRYVLINQIPRSYLGAAKEGSYGYWVPADRLDLAPFSIHDTRPNAAQLAMVAKIEDPSEPMTLEVRMIIIVTTVSQLFAPEFMTGCDRATELAMLMLSQVPNYCCNPTHVEKISKVANHVWKHRDKVVSGALTAFKAAKMLAPILATALA